MDMKIADRSGTWLINTGAFRMHDPESNTSFEPGMPTKATATAWAAGQPTLQPTADPMQAPEPVKEAKEVKLSKSKE